MNFHIKLASNSFGHGVMPYVKMADGWHEGAELFVKTAQGWRTVWRKTVTFINTVDRTAASIYALMGQPTKPRNYVFINRATIAGAASGFALRTGVFPAGSKLTIINEGYIRGAGGNGGYPGAAGPGGNALQLDMDATLDNSQGYLFGGGGGGGYTYWAAAPAYAGGGGGAGRPGGAYGGMYQVSTFPVYYPSSGTDTAGGGGGTYGGTGVYGASGGGLGAPGNSATTVGGAAGAAIRKNGKTLFFNTGNDASRVKGAIA